MPTHRNPSRLAPQPIAAMALLALLTGIAHAQTTTTQETPPAANPPASAETPNPVTNNQTMDADIAARPLSIGDPAPSLYVSTWLQGEAVPALAPGTVYVIEHWATWCGPCIAMMPKLSALQAAHADKGLVVVGITSEDEPEQTLRSFVRKQGERMTYRVALDDAGRTERAWMEAAKQRGIPFAFVVDRAGKIAFMGHPVLLEDVVPQVLDGTWDISKAQLAQQRDRELLRLRDAFAKLSSEGQFEQAAAVLTKGLEQSPSLGVHLAGVIFRVHAVQLDDIDAANAFASKATAQLLKDDADALNALAWTIADASDVAGRDLAISLAAAQRAHELRPTDAAIADTLAYVFAAQREWPKAVEAQRLAQSLATDDETKQRYGEALALYERNAKR